MRALSDRQIVALTLFTTAVCTVMTLITTAGDLLTTALAIPLAASAAFWSLRIMRRLMSRLVPSEAALEASRALPDADLGAAGARTAPPSAAATSRPYRGATER